MLEGGLGDGGESVEVFEEGGFGVVGDGFDIVEGRGNVGFGCFLGMEGDGKGVEVMVDILEEMEKGSGVVDGEGVGGKRKEELGGGVGVVVGKWENGNVEVEVVLYEVG